MVGGTQINSAGVQSSSGHRLTQVAGILFLVAYLGLVALVAESALHLRHLAGAETKISVALLATTPLLAVRMLYLLLVDFANSETFSQTHGSVYARLGMAIIEELIIVILFVTVGMVIPRMAERMPAQHVLLHGAGKDCLRSERWIHDV